MYTIDEINIALEYLMSFLTTSVVLGKVLSSLEVNECSIHVYMPTVAVADLILTC